MRSVDLVYDKECPNVELARANLRLAFSVAGLKPHWQEHQIGDPEAPTRTRGFGSPTILVDGRDLADVEPDAESCCRIYAGRDEIARAPSVGVIRAALMPVSSPDGAQSTLAPMT